MQLDGIDWDEGNSAKCQKHGVTLEAIEWLFQSRFRIFDDPHDVNLEQRYRAIGKDDEGRISVCRILFSRAG